MDYIDWIETQKEYKTDYQVKTSVLITSLILTLVFFCIGDWFFCAYSIFVLIAVSYEQMEAQHKLDFLEKPSTNNWH